MSQNEHAIPQVPQPDDAVVGKAAGAQMLATACATRDAFYASLGDVDADVLAPLVNPAFMGGPRWPSLRQAWRVIRRADTIILASDGLSDPFEDDDDVFVPRGHLLEVCIEAPLAAFDGQAVAQSWLFDAIYQISQNVADHGSIDLLVQRHGSVSMVLDVQEAPTGLEDEHGQLGVLLAQGTATIPPSFGTPYGEVMLLTATVLQPAELAHIGNAADKAQSRRDLAAALAASPTGHLSVAQRPAVIPR
ncbi:hypothetical protein GCN74_27305 [Janthinobacterium sp. FT14W]|uniref:hypothetical protein n=1 Tax=Janthinobacterium sp. FT14W TaxID=2654253 RepID=UPI0012641193|nr:hypothetical protein [Janthinobacterium sp. FT14W]KAB8049888.1 hypothetical protein GCN74_27305 [Janthinobacterium sp. FT14W]